MRVLPQNPSKTALKPLFSVQRLHGGEQQHIANRLTIGQQHAHSVDAEADAARSWGQQGPFRPLEGRFSGCFSAFLFKSIVSQDQNTKNP